MTTTPQEPNSDPDIVPSGEPEEPAVDPVVPGEPEETEHPE